MRLESLSQPLRAMAREQNGESVILEAELPWLTLGSQVDTEVDGHLQHGRVRWVGLDVTRRGAARLRILVGPDDVSAFPAPEHTGPMPAMTTVVKPLRRRHPASWLALIGCACVIALAVWLWPQVRANRLASSDPPDHPIAKVRAPAAVTIPHAEAVRAPEPPRRLRARVRKFSRLW
jgi:hypothetical protein